MSLSRSRRPTPATPGQLLGEALVHQGLINSDQLDWALTRGVRTGARLGRVLLSEGLLDRRDLQRALAQTWDAPYVDLIETQVDEALVSLFVPARMAAEGWVPVCRDGGGVVVATAERPTEELRARIRAALGGTAVRFAVTTDWDVQNVLLRVFHEFGVDTGATVAPAAARAPAPRTALWGTLALFGLAGALVAGVVLAPTATLIGVVLMANLVVLGGSARRVARRARVAREARRARAAARRGLFPAHTPRGDGLLPDYTILVPLRGDPSAVPGLIADLERLDYPREKLQIMLLMEHDDRATRAAARAVGPTEIIRFVSVRAGVRRSRSALLNIGLAFARGEAIVVYDAVDRPGREQLRAAAGGFAAGGGSTVALECSGGSRHFRTATLRELGGWSPGDLGADADLWLRALAAGHRIGRLSARTGRAPGRLEALVSREARRIEGDLRAALTHARAPRGLVGPGGRRRLAGVLGLLGGALEPPALGVLLLASGLWLTGLTLPPGGWAGHVPAVGVASLVLAAAVALWPHAVAPRKPAPVSPY